MTGGQVANMMCASCNKAALWRLAAGTTTPKFGAASCVSGGRLEGGVLFLGLFNMDLVSLKFWVKVHGLGFSDMLFFNNDF